MDQEKRAGTFRGRGRIAGRGAGKRVAAGFLCLQLAASGCVYFSPAEAAAENALLPETVIDEMLAEGAYVEGEAIALVKNGAGPIPGEERISAVDGDHVASAAGDAGMETDPSAAEALRRLSVSRSSDSSRDDAYRICHITDHSRTTKEILQELYSSPDTIAAEPNYVLHPDSTWTEETEEEALRIGETEKQEEGRPSEEAEPMAGSRLPMPGDLSDMQWDLGRTEGKQYTTSDCAETDYLLDPPLWQSGHNDPDAGANSSGTVCVVDSGLDVTNPEFDGVLYEFSEEQQERLGCGRYGYNATAEDEGDDPGDLTDHNMHGTHVAGIIAANWDGHGISGIVHGAKIFGVRIYREDGIVSDEASTLRAFEFLIRCAREVNLKAVNCSWGYIKPQLIQSVLVDALGAQGAVTVYASGNRSLNVDEMPDSGPSNSSIYAVSVDGAGMDGKMGHYSCWGQTSTDLFGPGSSILSVVPEVIESGMKGSVMRKSVFRHFIPELTEKAHLLYGPDHMDKGQSGVRFFDKNPALSTDAKEIGPDPADTGFDDRACVGVNITRIGPAPEDGGPGEYDADSFYMAVPSDRVKDVRWIGAKLSADRGLVYGKIASVTCLNEAGETVELRNDAADALNKGISSMSRTTLSSYQWSLFSVDVRGYVDAANEVHEMSAEQRDENIDLMDYEDPGRIEGVYAWEDSGREYVIARIEVGERMPGKPVPDHLLFDDVALGDEGTVNGAYYFMSGTSMATPAVSASLAVIAKDEPEQGTLDEKQLAELALERVAKLYAAAEYDPDLQELCRTGGRIVLGNLPDDPKKLAPLIDEVMCEGGKMTLKGFFFGDSGTLEIDGKAQEYLNWSDGTITADLSGIASGSHVAKITNPQGVSMQVVVAVSNPGNGTPLLENMLSVPVKDPALLEDVTAFFHGQMTEYDGKLYAVSTRIDYEGIALWSFDPAADLWEKCANLPEALDGYVCSGLAGYRGKIFVFGSESSDGTSPFWDYDLKTGAWTEHPLEDELTAMGLCVFHDRLFGVCYSLSDDNGLWLVDPEKNEITSIPDTELPYVELGDARLAATDSCLYLYAPDSGEGDEDYQAGALMRITYQEKAAQDAEAAAVQIEDLTDALNDLIDNDQNGAVALAAGSDYCVIAANAKDGKNLHILRDDSRKAEAMDCVASYHSVIYPMAVMSGDTLYVSGIDETASDIMFLRSQRME